MEAKGRGLSCCLRVSFMGGTCKCEWKKEWKENGLRGAFNPVSRGEWMD